MSKQTTIRDVAERSGVSTATVSRVLSGTSYPVSAELRRRVQRAAAELDYRPNYYGRGLRKRGAGEVGVIVPNLSNPFYGELLEHVQAACLAADLIPVIHASSGDSELERRLIEHLLARRPSGLLLSPIGDVRALAELVQGRCPVILFDQTVAEGIDWPSVCFDFRAGGELATAHLLETGHRRLALLAPDLSRRSRRLILEGMNRAIVSHRLRDPGLASGRLLEADDVDYDSSRIVDLTHYADRIAARLAAELAEGTAPDGIVAINDLHAASLIVALQARGVQLPESISIIGFDDTSLARFVRPALTTIRQDIQATVDAALELLLTVHAGEEAGRIDLAPRLIERASVMTR